MELTKQQYSKLNNYFNELCVGLSEKDTFFLKNTRFFGMISVYLKKILEDYKISTDKKEDCFTFFEIFEKAREILKSISPDYLEDFDKLVPSGKIEVDYKILDIPYEERKFEISFFTPLDETIHIGNSFNYDAVAILIHEYMHKTNKSTSIARYLLTEYISIYFELYAYEYLKKDGVDSDKLNLSDRLALLLNNLKFVDDVSFLIYTYDRLGDFDENTYSKIDYAKVSKEDLDNELLYALEKFEKAEKKYNESIDIKNEESFREYIANICSFDYRYVLGTLIAYYSFYNLPKDKILRLNKAIKNNIVTNLDDALNIIGIDLDDYTIKESINCIIKYIEDNNLSKKEEKVIK